MQQPTQHPLQQPIQQPAPPYAAPSGSSSPGSPTDAAPFAHDDALIGPPSPGSSLVRLLQVEARLPEAWGDLKGEVHAAYASLAEAVGKFQGVQGALDVAHATLSRVWERARADEQAPALCEALGFPPPAMKASEVGAVDVSTILVTHARPLRQVLSTIAFRDAPNATGYRLLETKMLPNGEDYEDMMVANYLPTFTRVRLATGEHRFRIESRNSYTRTLSEYFTITVPAP